MASVALRRFHYQKENFTKIVGADIVITNYLLERGSICIVEEDKIINGNTFTVGNYENAFDAVTELCIKIQTIKSEGKCDEFDQLTEKYTKYPITLEQGNRYRQISHDRVKAALGKIALAAEIYPLYKPVVEYDCFFAATNVVDVVAEWPKDIVEEQFAYKHEHDFAIKRLSELTKRFISDSTSLEKQFM